MLLNTPEKLSRWMTENFCYVGLYKKEHELTLPQVMFAKRSGNCGDFTVFAFDILQKNGYEPYMMTIQISLDSPYNHGICVFQTENKYFILNNGILQGPFQTLEEIAKRHNKNWRRYLLFDNITDFFNFQNPIVTVCQ